MRPGAHLQLWELELFVAVAESGSLGRVAARYGLSQPAVSARMTNLERVLGMRLLDRDPSGTRLTPAGAEVVGAAASVLDAAGRLALVAGRLRAQTSGRLRVAASYTVAEHLVPVWIAELRREMPELALTVEVANSSQVMATVAEGSVEIGFVEGAGRPPPGLGAQAVRADRLVVVVGPRHPWTRRRAGVSGSELASASLVVREPGSGTREVLERALAPWGGVSPTLELGSSAAILATARRGGGPAVLSELAAAADLEAGSLRRVEVHDVDLTREIRAVWSGGPQPAGLAGRMLAVARRGVPLEA